MRLRVHFQVTAPGAGALLTGRRHGATGRICALRHPASSAPRVTSSPAPPGFTQAGQPLVAQVLCTPLPCLLGVLNGAPAPWLLFGTAHAVEAAWGEKQCKRHHERSFSPERPSGGSTPQVTTKAGAGPGQSRCQGLYPVLPSGFRGLRPWAISLCFPRYVSRQLDPTGNSFREGPALCGSG